MYGLRHYEVTSSEGKTIGVFPSITTVLGETSDKSGIANWRKRVGEVEADRITNMSRHRGSIMHRLVELYKPIKGSNKSRLNKLKKIAETDKEVNEQSGDLCGDIWLEAGWKMFMKFYNNSEIFFDRVKKVIAAESFLWSKVGYAGTVDNISEMTDGNVLVIDYKNSRRPKREEWVQDYFVQGSAYFIAYWERSGKKPNGVEIWIANEEDGMPQIFKLTVDDIKHYFKEFQRRLELFKEKYPCSAP
jgi:genome maintenance exonuclease 1